MFNIIKLHHVSLVVHDTEAAIHFYRDVLGFRVSEKRPVLGFPGAWFDLPGGQQLHLLQLDNPDPVDGRPAHGGRDRHTAFHVTELKTLKKTLDRHQISYTESQSGRAALFCRDPDGNALEFIEIKT